MSIRMKAIGNDKNAIDLISLATTRRNRSVWLFISERMSIDTERNVSERTANGVS